jgi:hypothetical protein
MDGMTVVLERHDDLHGHRRRRVGRRRDVRRPMDHHGRLLGLRHPRDIVEAEFDPGAQRRGLVVTRREIAHHEMDRPDRRLRRGPARQEQARYGQADGSQIGATLHPALSVQHPCHMALRTRRPMNGHSSPAGVFNL